MSVWLVLPTYNEAENIETVVRKADSVLDESGYHDRRILIVDDSSPDGTGAIADRLAEELESVAVVHRTSKEGLGRAYLNGFAVALEGGAEYVLEMDSDLSHDPNDLPRLLEAARDADLVLGSRYVPGGGVVDWGPLRRLLSRGGSLYARTILGLKIRDLTGGFKCFRRATLEAIDLPSVRSEGYAFQIELTYRAIKRSLRVKEIPITFRERTAGQSKMSARIAFEAILLVPKIRRSSQVG